MGSHTVNEKKVKKGEYTLGAAGYKDNSSITVMMFHPELIKIIADKSEQQDMSKLVKAEDFLYETEEFVAVKTFNNKELGQENPKAKVSKNKDDDERSN